MRINQTGLLRTLILGLSFVVINHAAFSQCIISVESTNGYTVEIVLEPTGIIAPDNCPFGYNYNIEFDYDITFTGSNIPSGLWTLQGTMDCSETNDAGIFFPLPNGGGTGTGATIGNPYNPNTDCATASVESLGCTTFNLQIHGPGIPNQVLTCEASAVSLPIELNYFRAKELNKDVLIEWETEVEINNDYFLLEHSEDGIEFETIHIEKGAGYSYAAIQYTYADRQATTGKNFYRLTQVDFNGNTSSSDIQLVSLERKDKISAYPNPIVDIVSVTNVSGEIIILDQLGAIVLQKSIGNNIQNIDLDLGNLSNGVYFIRSNNEVIKLLKF